MDNLGFAPPGDKPRARHYTRAIMERNPIDYSLIGLEALAAVAAAGSLAKAGERLGVSGSAVSKQLTRLESRLGVKLLRRTTRSVALSPAGLQLATEYGKARAILAAAVDAVCADGASPRGSLRVSVPPSFGIHVMPAILKEFIACYPAVHIDLDLSGRLVNVTSEGYDVAIRVAREPDPNYVAVVIGAIEWGLYASADCLARHGTPAVPEDLAGLPYIASATSGKTARLVLTAAAGPQAVPVTPVLTTPSIEATHALVKGGVGVGALPDYLGHLADDRPALIRLLPAWTISGEHGNRLYALMLPGRSLRPAARAFVEFLRTRCGAAASPGP